MRFDWFWGVHHGHGTRIYGVIINCRHFFGLKLYKGN